MTDLERPQHSPVYVHRSKIAALAGVQRPTVTTWERRNPKTFPEPEGSDDKGEYFRLDHMIAWLSDRRVPDANRDPRQEPPGITYGERVRRAHTAENAARVEAVLTEDDAEQRSVRLAKLLGPNGFRLRGRTVSESDYILILMCLIFLRVRANDSWQELIDAAGTRSQSGEALLREMGWRIDQVLREHGVAPGMRSVVQGLGSSRVQDVREVLEHCGRLALQGFSSLFERFAAISDPHTGEYFTPPSLATLMADLATGAKPVSGLIYDPHARGGELLCAAVRHSAESGGAQVRGVSADERTLRLAAMRIAIAGGSGEFRLGRLSPWLHGDVPAKVVVVNPPFNRKSQLFGEYPSTGWEFGEPPPHNDNFAWLQHAAANLTSDGVAAVLMPAQAAVSADAREAAIRRNMVEAGVVRAVIALPAKMFPNTDVAATLWIITRPQQVEQSVLLVDVRNIGVQDGKRILLPELAAAAILNQYTCRKDMVPGQAVEVTKGGSAIVVSLETIRAAGHLLRPSDYLRQAEDVRFEALADDLGRAFADFAQRRDRATSVAVLEQVSVHFWPNLPEPGSAAGRWEALLAEICDIQPGPSHDLMPKDEARENCSVPVVKRHHLRDFRVLSDGAESISWSAAARLDKYLLQPNDILLVRSGAMMAPAIVGADQGPMLLGNNLVRLRIKDTAKVDALFLLGHLSARRVLSGIAARATGTAVATLSKDALGRQPIILPPIDEQHRIGEAMRAIDGQVAAFEALAAASAKARASLADALATGHVGLNDSMSSSSLN
ncbi:N-6 DNA methylase [Nocardia sp. NPDC056000]|uniref:type I restriction-modification system subunit M/S n=1 Tax=Nocardia sp. NPDC056000 TaxID=3345674 RepID=UPI0035E05FC8